MVILKGEDSLPAASKLGIDLATLHGPRGGLEGGPTCFFHGKNVPCIVECSPHAGITPRILSMCFKHMDKLQLFDRSEGIRPVVILDGHNSRFDLKFLNYIRNPAHPWSVAFGLPYATHIWQVADSEEQNGAYKMTTNQQE